MSTIDLVLLRQELIRDEGLRLDAYQDTLGLWTQGVGHLLSSPPPHAPWTKETCLQVLEQDIQVALAGCEKMPCWVSLDTDNRRRALVNMRFQLGSKLLTFKKALSAMQRQAWKEVAEQLRDSQWYLQTPVRAERVIRLISGSGE